MENILGSSLQISSSSEHFLKTLELIGLAEKTILIHCHDLTPRIYNHPDISNALSKFITSNSKTRQIKILINDISSIIACDHKILTASRRLSSNIAIKKIAKHHINHTESFILVDNKIFIHRTDYSQFEGTYACDQKQSKAMLNLFNELWSASENNSNLNRLYI